MGTSRGGVLAGLCLVMLVAVSGVESTLTKDFYDESCPSIYSIVKEEVQKAVEAEKRMAASLVRLHFHDCFVNGCDGSLLLDDTKTFTGEKTAAPNNNSARGFDVIDTIKGKLEKACPETVSCADILAITSRDASVEVGGKTYEVLFGRRDSLTANFSAANDFLPSPFENYTQLVKSFSRVGLNEIDLIALSGAHTIGRARCGVIKPHLNDSNIDPGFRDSLEKVCPVGGNNSLLQNLDLKTPDKFDNSYFKNLRRGEGLLRSDQVLYSTPGSNVEVVTNFATSQATFFHQFGVSTIRMGNLKPLTGKLGEIRVNCRVPNSGPLIAYE